MSKKALVTGALGHTGSFLVHELVEQGWDVIATDLGKEAREDLMKKETIFSSKFQYKTLPEHVKYISADLRKKETLKPLFEAGITFDVIFHPASLYDYYAPLDLLREINVGGLKNFLEVIYERAAQTKQNPSLLIHWSTCGVYGEPEYKRNSEGFILPIEEDAVFDPPNNYSISKKEQEELIQEYQKEKGLRAIIVRSAPIYGPYQTYGAFHIYYLCHKMGNMVLPDVFPPQYKLMMPMIHVEDLVRAAIYLSQRKESIGESYNIVGDSTTEEEWMEYMYQELGINYFRVPIHWKMYKFAARVTENILKNNVEKARKLGIRPKIDPPMIEYVTHNYFFSNKKLKETGFEFKYGDFMSGTRQTIRWYKDSGWFETESFGEQTYIEKYSKKHKKAKKEEANA